MVAGALGGGLSDASGTSFTTYDLTAGDIARVPDAQVGCRVVKRGAPPATMLDCRRAGSLTGTYGVLLGPARVRVVRFESSGVARVVFTARHGGRATCCVGASGVAP